MSQLTNPELVRNLTPYFVRAGTTEKAAAWAHSNYMGLLGLRGFWPMSSVNSSGEAVDVSGVGNNLTGNGSLTFDYANSLYLPSFARFVATSSQYLSHVDAADFDILGTESYIQPARRGLTVGCWFSPDIVDGTRQGLVSKYVVGANQRSFSLQMATTSNDLQFSLSSNGTSGAAISATHPGGLSVAGWYFAVGRFDPSTEVAVFQNGTWERNTTSVPASIFNSTAPFNIGMVDGGSLFYFDGEIAFAFLCAAHIPDSIIFNLYQATKGIFEPNVP